MESTKEAPTAAFLFAFRGSSCFWRQHYYDILTCRVDRCTRRMQRAPTAELSRLSISLLATAIWRISKLYGSKDKRERDLLDYARAVVAQGIPPNDRDPLGAMSAVALAAYHGYSQLLLFLLVECGCSAEGALTAAVENQQHESILVLFQECRDEQRAELHRETALARIRFQTDPKWIQPDPKWILVVQALHPDCNVLHWSRQVHWSFPGADRSMLNWMWHAVCHDNNKIGDASIPMEIWLRVFGFIGRGWWTMGDQNGNGWQELAPSMRTN